MGISKRMLGLCALGVCLAACSGAADDATAGGDAGGDAGGGLGAASGLHCGSPIVNDAPGNSCQGSAPPALQLTLVAEGLNQPLLLTHAPGDATRLFVVQRGGIVRLIKDGVLQSDPFLDISDRVNSGGLAGERGLLGLAFEPDFDNTRRLWVNYSRLGGNGDTVIESYQVDADGDFADASTAAELLTVAQPDRFGGNHNGGMLAFGPDGCLFVAMGDGGGSNDTYRNGQDASTPLAALLRLDVDNHSDSMGAPGNSLTHPHVWSYGLRNPWRFSFDRSTGDLYIGDVGQDGWEEVDVEAAGVGGRNYGWPIMEGMECGAQGCDTAGLTLPVAVQETGRNQSVIGGYVYRGSEIPGLIGRYLYGDYNSRRIWSFTWKGDGEICDEYEVTDDLGLSGSLSSFGEDANGELYVVEYSSGRVLRIDRAD